MTNAEKFKEVFGEELSFDEYVIICNGKAEDCDTCKYGEASYLCSRYKWADEEYTGKGTNGHFGRG